MIKAKACQKEKASTKDPAKESRKTVKTQRESSKARTEMASLAHPDHQGHHPPARGTNPWTTEPGAVLYASDMCRHMPGCAAWPSSSF
mmetsp:Transcript_73995/g.176427  ORF Transcript_73995/g.176427 Transcript_73995/m.176427 type:complete len:88 (-) Transcript_73995:70-333(-)